MKEQQKQNLIEMMQQDEKLGLYDDTSNKIKNATAMQQLFIELESKHPQLFSTFTNEGKNFINDFYKFLDIEKEQYLHNMLVKQYAQHMKEFVGEKCEFVFLNETNMK